MLGNIKHLHISTRGGEEQELGMCSHGVPSLEKELQGSERVKGKRTLRLGQDARVNGVLK